MNLFIYIFYGILSIIVGLIVGCCLRLLDEGISIKWAPLVFKILYVNSIGFIGYVTENKTSFIEMLASTEIKKGTENRKEIIEKKIKEYENIWGKKFLRSLRRSMIKYFIHNYDFILKTTITTLKEISIKNMQKNENVMRNISFRDINLNLNPYMKAGRL